VVLLPEVLALGVVRRRIHRVPSETCIEPQPLSDGYQVADLQTSIGIMRTEADLSPIVGFAGVETSERLKPHNPKVEGSSLAPATKILECWEKAPGVSVSSMAPLTERNGLHHQPPWIVFQRSVSTKQTIGPIGREAGS
jgi:hypothetical protein